MSARTDLRSERGQAAVEFALVAPILIVLLLAIVQMGITFNNYLTVTDAARAGARKAVVARFSGISVADIRAAVQDAAGGLDPAKLGVTIADPSDPTFTTAGSTLTVTVTYPYSINVLGLAVASGNLTSTMTDRLE
ncbi:MAG TPA: TadE/TadG family type IV pilus assembly protein [Gaiellaceae bacterium]|nr:TadE/TadG family type IV pilus assembly protein [Gaiellaceae bacterium]